MLMKRTLSILLTLGLLLCFAALSSCQKEPVIQEITSESETETAPQKETEEEETMTEEEKKTDHSIEMITYNIAYYDADSPNMVIYHKDQSPADYTVERRAGRLDSLVALMTPDILALQEVNSTWWPYLITNEDSIANKFGYGWSGNLSTTGQTDGNGLKINDLYNLLLWSEKTFEEIESGVFRLAPKQGNDTNKNRLCAYAILKNRETGTETLYASAHFCTRPNEEMEALSQTQAKTLTEKLVSLAKGRPIIVGGDFNANSTTATYQHITQTASFYDARATAEINEYMHMNSARIWGKVAEEQWKGGKGLPIDHIFFLGDTVYAEEWRVLTDTYNMYDQISLDVDKIGINYDLSDHMAVYTRFREIQE